MPLYEYECDACGQRFELIQKFSDGPPEACPKCGKGPMQRQASSPAFHLKGSGWYVTDYARKGSSGEGDGSKAEGSKAEGSKAEGDKKAAASSSEGGSDSKKADSTPPSTTSTPTKAPS